MAQANLKPMTLADFLDWKERQSARYEFAYGAIIMIAGGSDAHDTIRFDDLVLSAPGCDWDDGCVRMRRLFSGFCLGCPSCLAGSTPLDNQYRFTV